VPFFAVAPGRPRERSGSDVLFLVVSVLSGAVLAVVSVPPSGFETAVMAVIAEVPDGLGVLWRLGVASLILWVLAVVTTAVLRRRGEVLVDALSTSLVAIALAMVAARWLNGDWPSVSQVATGGSTGTVPLAALALGSGVSFAASPHLSLPFRRFGRWCVWSGAASVVLLGSTTPGGALLSLLTAIAAASAVHLVLGSQVGRPSPEEVVAALEALDLQVGEVHESARQPGGVLLVEGIDPSGAPLVVRVYGRDARDTQLLSRLWRTIWYRDAAPFALTRQQQVEHEGFVTLLAASRGVPVPRIVVAGTTEANDALVVLEGGGVELGGRERDELDDADVAGIWDVVARLHEAGMAHGALSPDTFERVGSAVRLADLAPVTVVASEDRRRIDLAQTLVTTAVMVGIERAVVTAADRLDDDDVTDLLPYLQIPACGAALRHAVKEADLDIEALRSAAAGVVGVDQPEIVELRRVSPRTMVTVLLLAMVAFALVSALGDVGLSEIIDTVQGADPAWFVAALVVAQLPFFSQAVSTRGACPRPLPYGPVALLQMAIAFVALAVPSTAGRLALGIRFFQRQGVPPATAVSISAIDSFSGFLVQIALLVLTLVFGVGAVDMTLSLPEDANLDGLVTLLAVLAVALVVLVVVGAALPKVRNLVLDHVRPVLREAFDTIRGLRSLGKVVQLFGGNLVNQLLFAAALGLSLRAFGGELNLATLVVVYVAAALFGGLMPVPGGIGVVEAALAAGLIAAGIDNTTATATALSFRVLTFYLPPVWGWMAMRWLERRSYL
jgi:uncharacterized membrane protein YbhN (UPF0104 family)